MKCYLCYFFLCGPFFGSSCLRTSLWWHVDECIFHHRNRILGYESFCGNISWLSISQWCTVFKSNHEPLNLKYLCQKSFSTLWGVSRATFLYLGWAILYWRGITSWYHKVFIKLEILFSDLFRPIITNVYRRTGMNACMKIHVLSPYLLECTLVLIFYKIWYIRCLCLPLKLNLQNQL